jgi:DNA-binding NarL/FixJ family response regulator
MAATLNVEILRTRIMLVDHHPLFREGVAAVLATQSDMELVAEAVNGEEAIAKFRIHQPDITLMELQLPSKNGLDAIRTILSEFAGARIVVLTTYKGDMQARHALKAGVRGYLLKSALRKDLLHAIRQVRDGHRYIQDDVAHMLVRHMADDGLSLREEQVLGHVAGGYCNKRIATHMGISVETVKTHMKSILAKINAKDRTQAVVIAMRRGMIDV